MGNLIAQQQEENKGENRTKEGYVNNPHDFQKIIEQYKK